jgi:protein-S-isoprenylcysteine O-methyltransferase Ste14
MTRAVGPLLKTLVFTIVVPGTVTVIIPRYLMRGFPTPDFGALPALGSIAIIVGACIYFRCAWEFAVRGLGTPAPIAPTKFLVVSGLHRYVRNPMYFGVALLILGEAALFGSLHLAEYAAIMLLIAHTFVVLYEEPTLQRQFGESYEDYRGAVPRWIPRFREKNQSDKSLTNT